MTDESHFLTNRMHKLTEAERKTVEMNQGLVGECINQKFKQYVNAPNRRGDGLITYKELFRVGQFGLIEALEKWDPEKGAFTTCAMIWIRNKISRWLKEYAFRHMRTPKWLIQMRGVSRKEILEAVKDGIISEYDGKVIQGFGSPPDRIAYAVTLGMITEEDAKHRTQDWKRQEKATNLQPVNEALDHTIDPADRKKNRQALLRIMMQVPCDTDSLRIGRQVALKIGALDGGTGLGAKAKDTFEEIGMGLGLTASQARRSYEAFVLAARDFVIEHRVEYPGEEHS